MEWGTGRLRRLALVLIAAYLGVGALWGVIHLREFPHYGDTVSYFQYARDLGTDRHREVGYGWLLAATARLSPGTNIEDFPVWSDEERRGRPCPVSSGFVGVQVFQIWVGFAALACFLASFGGGLDRATPASRQRLFRYVLLIALLGLDPLIMHFNLSLMTDGLALSASLLFCASLLRLAATRGWGGWAPAAVFASYLFAAVLRGEKRWVLLATSIATLLIWRVWNNRGELGFARGWQRRMVLAVGLSGLGCLVSLGIHSSTERDYGWRWPATDSVIHFRLLFPHLSGVYDDLPQSARSLLSREDARRYDSHLNDAKRVIDRVTDEDPELRRKLSRDLLLTVLPRRWIQITIDLVRDTFENLLATPSYYFRVAASRWMKRRHFRDWFPSDAALWSYTRLTFHHPRLALTHMLLFLVLAGVCLPIAVRRGLLHRQHSGADWCRASWAPVAAFWLTNALAFAVAHNNANVRYMLFSHVVILLILYAPFVRWLLPDSDRVVGAARPTTNPRIPLDTGPHR